jgi:hypothetical protein
MTFDFNTHSSNHLEEVGRSSLMHGKRISRSPDVVGLGEYLGRTGAWKAQV